MRLALWQGSLPAADLDLACTRVEAALAAAGAMLAAGPVLPVLTIAYAGCRGTGGDLSHVGNSVIAGPHGEILTQSADQRQL